MTEETTNSPAGEVKAPVNFIHQMIDEDIRNNKNGGRVHTRFPPEPNGYLHIGHAKSICLNFGTATKYNGKANLRFDDTNPTKEDTEYVDSIMEDVRWLGFDWDDRLFYASDYFEQLYEWAVKMIREGNAYVDDLNAEQISEYRGTVTRPGKESPFRSRSVEENLDLFTRMKNGEFADGTKVLRAKLDMAHPNMLMRDPIMYRIIHTDHHRTGDKWCIYPMYDYAHGQSDYLEGITHSICTLEFEIHRPLYEWYLQQVAEGEYRPQQIEFARLNLTYTVMSKRKLLQLVNEGIVNGWDDPRMPTICGLRRRGFTAEAIRNFADIIGIAKRDQVIDVALLEFCIREDLNKRSNRAMAVMNPVKLILDNYPEGEEEILEAINNPEDPDAGMRSIPFSRELYIEREDFMEDPPNKFFRLKPGGEVRLKYGYVIRCESIVKDENGQITEIHCIYEADTKRGMPNSNKKVKGTLHWVSAKHALPLEVRLYDRLFVKENPDDLEEGQNFKDFLNPDSLKTITAFAEPSLGAAKPGDRYQFERLGYFCADLDSVSGKPVFNRTVPLKDNWAKIGQAEK
ncbi:MAG: glutamine--tRNA ligase/YqeY domain fusion protein [Bacteroidales bacterium]|nr:glutamine--tRNA ligase/YqeY domain fusion protein [Bacteroidales bacterium]